MTKKRNQLGDDVLTRSPQLPGSTLLLRRQPSLPGVWAVDFLHASAPLQQPSHVMTSSLFQGCRAHPSDSATTAHRKPANRQGRPAFTIPSMSSPLNLPLAEKGLQTQRFSQSRTAQRRSATLEVPSRRGCRPPSREDTAGPLLRGRARPRGRARCSSCRAQSGARSSEGRSARLPLEAHLALRLEFPRASCRGSPQCLESGSPAQATRGVPGRRRPEPSSPPRPEWPGTEARPGTGKGAGAQHHRQGMPRAGPCASPTPEPHEGTEGTGPPRTRHRRHR